MYTFGALKTIASIDNIGCTLCKSNKLRFLFESERFFSIKLYNSFVRISVIMTNNSFHIDEFYIILIIIINIKINNIGILFKL